MKYRNVFIICWSVMCAWCFCCYGMGTRIASAVCCPADMDGIAQLAGDMLERNRLFYLDRTLPILSTSFVNLDDLRETSAFGRLLGARVGSRFSQHGYRVLELRLGKGSIIIQEKNGEFVLSRDTSRLDGCHEAQAIIVGTYSLVENLAFVSVRLVNMLDNTVMSSYDFSIRLGNVLKSLAEKKAEVLIGTRGSGEITDIEEEKSDSRASGENPISSGSVLLKLSNPLAAKIVQAQLSRQGFYTWKIDGIWKKRSRTALADFKRKHDLPNATRWDLDTQVALFNPDRK